MKRYLKAALISGAAALALFGGSGALGYNGVINEWRGDFKKAQSYDNYRLEELTKVQEQFDSGEITQSEFDVRVSYINGTEDMSVFRNIWVEEGHEDCCEALYKEGLWQSEWGAAKIMGATLLCCLGIGASALAVSELKDRDL